MTSSEELISTGQAAKLLGCHRSRIDQLIHEGRLIASTLPPANRRKGTKRYLRKADVERIAAERIAAGHAPKPGRPRARKKVLPQKAA